MRTINFLSRGPIDYMAMDPLQRYCHREVAAQRMPDTLLIWEADHVYTAGRRTQDADIPDPSIPVIRMDRGGSVTYHGPGQLVVYPIVKVRPPKDVVGFVRATERAVISVLADFGLETEQVEGRSGVWIRGDHRLDAKLCAIGMKFADDATMHGLALNVSADIERFTQVVPCGISDAGVSTLAMEGIDAGMAEVAPVLAATLGRAYEPFLARTGAPHTESDPAEIIAAMHSDGAGATLPAATGSLWQPATPNSRLQRLVEESSTDSIGGVQGGIA